MTASEQPPRNGVTLKDVAARAGVSAATVSAVVRGLEEGTIRVGDETRARVEGAIRDLNYRPNRSAQSLRTQRTGMIAVVVPDLTNPLFPQFVRAAQQRAEHHEVLAMVWDSDNSRRRELAALSTALDYRIDGMVIVTEYLTIEDLEPVLAANISVAATDRRLTDPRIDLVSEDLSAGAALAVEHLIDLGHRRIGYLAGDISSTAGSARLDGYRTALANAGIAADEHLIVGGTFDRATGYRGVNAVRELSPPPTAVLAANDIIAIGALKACSDRGVSVPDELAIVGIDNTPESADVFPALTTMDVKPAAVAERLVDIVIERSKGDRTGDATRELFTPSLIRRATT